MLTFLCPYVLLSILKLVSFAFKATPDLWSALTMRIFNTSYRAYKLRWPFVAHLVLFFVFLPLHSVCLISFINKLWEIFRVKWGGTEEMVHRLAERSVLTIIVLVILTIVICLLRRLHSIGYRICLNVSVVFWPKALCNRQLIWRIGPGPGSGSGYRNKLQVKWK